MRIGGLTTTTAQIKGYDGETWTNLLADPRKMLQLLSVPWPSYLAPGRLILYDDLEGVLKWQQMSGTVTRDSSKFAFGGDYALKCLTGASADDDSIAARTIPFPGLKKFRFMCHWCGNSSGVVSPQTCARVIIWTILLHDHVHRYHIELAYLNYEAGNPVQKWQYKAAGGVWTDVPGGAQVVWCAPDANLWPYHNFVAVDFNISSGTPYINRLVSNELDLKNLNLEAYREDYTWPDGVLFEFGTVTDQNQAVEAYFDDVILGDTTQP